MTRRYGWIPVGATVAMVLVGCGAPPSDTPEPVPTASVSTPGSIAPTGPTSPSGSAPGSPTPDGTASTSVPDGSPSVTTSGSSGASTAPAPTSSGEVDLVHHQPATSWQQALAVARDRFDGALISIELGWDRDGLVYTVELVSEAREYEVDIAAGDGRVLAESTDALDEDEARSARDEAIDTPGIVAVSDAMAAAVESRSGRVVEWKLARNTRGVYYEFDIVLPGSTEDTEVHVDAISGRVIG